MVGQSNFGKTNGFLAGTTDAAHFHRPAGVFGESDYLGVYGSTTGDGDATGVYGNGGENGFAD